jgi:hypothetical protein
MGKRRKEEMCHAVICRKNEIPENSITAETQHSVNTAVTPILAKSDNNRKLVAPEILFFPICAGPDRRAGKQAMHSLTKGNNSEHFVLPGGLPGT